jgi:ATP-dependent helicase HrpB
VNPSELPIQTIREELRAAVATRRRFVLEAPTGSGKSTQVPQMLVDLDTVGGGQVVVLQPRRVAARMLARRVAWERRVQPGGEVGTRCASSACGAATPASSM